MTIQLFHPGVILSATLLAVLPGAQVQGTLSHPDLVTKLTASAPSNLTHRSG